MSKHVGIPIKVLHDAEGHTVTIELKNGEVFRGKLDEAEDNMNVHLSNCTKTAKDGRVSTLAKCAAPHSASAAPPAPARGLSLARAGRGLRRTGPNRSTARSPAARRSVFLRGSHVRFMVLPDILKNAPFFKKIETKQQKQAQAKSSSKARQAAQQRATGAPARMLPALRPTLPC